MSEPTPLIEQRLRRGLAAAADALPPAELTRRSPRRPPSGGRWYLAALGGAAAAVLVIGAVLVTRGSGDGGSDVIADESDETTPSTDGASTTAPPTSTPGPGPTVTFPNASVTNGALPGQAVVVGSEVRTYDATGAQTGAVSVAPLTSIQSASSDLLGGWVVCGMTDDPATSDQMMWFPAGGEARVIPAEGLWCVADAFQVVGTPEGPTAIYTSSEGADGESMTFHAVVLATGDDRVLELPVDPMAFYSWSATTDRIAILGETAGLQLFDLNTGEELPATLVDPTVGAIDLTLSSDGTTAAWFIQAEDAVEPDLVVADLTTGAELFREAFPISLEGAELSYDGTTVAVGNWYDDPTYPPVTVFPIADPQSRHTIDAHGVLL